MNKVNAIQQAVSDYYKVFQEASEKFDAIMCDLRQKIHISVEKEVNEKYRDSKVTVEFGVNPPFEREILLSIDVRCKKGSGHIYLTPNEGQALYEILKELYE